MAGFKLLSYASDQGPRAGLLVHDAVLDVEAALKLHGGSMAKEAGLATTSVLALLEQWDTARPLLAGIAVAFQDERALRSLARPLAHTRLLAPLLYPGAIYCAAANYTDHAREMNPDRALPDKATVRPYFFLKSPRHAVIGPEEPVRLPRHAAQIDWEAEIGVVIGRPASNVSVAEAMSYVAGYTIVNDLSARDQNQRTDWGFGADWFRGKTFDTSAPMGPWITPAEEIADPHRLAIQLRVNDQLMQDSSSRLMIFTIPEQIAYLSEGVTLLPGDVVSTGTPAGVGRPRGIFLKPGDEITIKIEGLGTLHNPVVAAEAAEGRAKVEVA